MPRLSFLRRFSHRLPVALMLAATGLPLFASQQAKAFEIVAHRGGRGVEPENTLDAFANALSIGVTALDADIVITKDTVPVIHHGLQLDEDIARGPDGRWLNSQTAPFIRSLTYRELRRDYDVGSLAPDSRLARQFPEQTRTDGAFIPSLAELLTLIRRARNQSVRLYLETRIDPRMRDASASPRSYAVILQRTLHGYRMLERTTVMSLDWITLGPMRQLAPEVRIGCMTAGQTWLDNLEKGKPGGSPWLAGRDLDDYDSVPDLVADFGCHTWLPFWGDLTADDIRRAKELRLEIVPWLADSPKDVEAAIRAGLDGVLTDWPEQARQVMIEQGMVPPPRTPVKP